MRGNKHLNLSFLSVLMVSMLAGVSFVPELGNTAPAPIECYKKATDELNGYFTAFRGDAVQLCQGARTALGPLKCAALASDTINYKQFIKEFDELKKPLEEVDGNPTYNNGFTFEDGLSLSPRQVLKLCSGA